MQNLSIEIQNNALIKKGMQATTAFFASLASHHRLINGVDAYHTGIDSPFLNVAYCGTVDETTLSATTRAISDFYSPFRSPWSMVVTPLSQPPFLVESLSKQELQLIESVPCMYLDLSTFAPLAHHPDIVIEELSIDDSLHEWIKPICDGFGVTDEGEAYRLLNVAVGEKKGVLKQFIARTKSEVVSSGTLFITDDAVMLHNIATKNSALRKGYGAALTQQLMQAAKNDGFKDCFLESSESGYNIYRRCGFRVYAVNHYFTL